MRLEVLANEGNLKHNVDILKKGSGNIVVARISANPVTTDVKSFLPCEFCNKFVLKRLLYNHMKTCKMKLHKLKSVNSVEGGEQQDDVDISCDDTSEINYIRRCEMLLISVTGEINEGTLTQLFDRMQKGEIKRLIKSDTLLSKYACLEMESLGPEEVQKKNDMHRVSQRVRTLSRLMLECRKEKAIPLFSSLLTCDNFDVVIRAGKAITF